MNCIADIDTAIRAAGLRENEVLREAGMDGRYLDKIRRGLKPLTGRTSSRVQLAIAELKRERRLAEREKATDGKRPWESRSAAQYRIAVSFVALAAGVKPSFILAADPARRATADPAWLRASRLRRIALYIANQFLHVPQADLARAASMTKSNVCTALKQLEDERGEGEIETILSAVEGAFEG
ncbi:Hypothetical protein NGAL_HAMBI2605_59350 [Neorhizobium galegae bv. orientalis]|nr:Hypothetical protein NGAL_HAMBI2605_59350 [Neorhizobium galegae bv. orientalis]